MQTLGPRTAPCQESSTCGGSPRFIFGMRAGLAAAPACVRQVTRAALASIRLPAARAAAASPPCEHLAAWPPRAPSLKRRAKALEKRKNVSTCKIRQTGRGSPDHPDLLDLPHVDCCPLGADPCVDSKLCQHKPRRRLDAHRHDPLPRAVAVDEKVVVGRRGEARGAHGAVVGLGPAAAGAGGGEGRARGAGKGSAVRARSSPRGEGRQASLPPQEHTEA